MSFCKWISRRAIVVGAALPGLALARNSPGKPLRIVLAGPPGGIIDVGGRAILDALMAELRHPVILDPRPGAGGMIAAQIVSSAVPDGSTLLLTVSEIAAIQFLTAVRFDLLRDLTPVATIGEGAAAICVPSGLPVNSLPDLIAYAKGHPGAVRYLNPGNGTRQHLIPEQINQQFGTGMLPIPYRGLPAGVADLIEQRIELGVVSTALALQHIDAGTLRAVAVLGERRLSSLPAVPTIYEQRLGAMNVRSTLTLFGPARLPPAMVRRLNRVVGDVLADPTVQSRLASADIISEVTDAEELRRRFADDQSRFASLLATLQLKRE